MDTGRDPDNVSFQVIDGLRLPDLECLIHLKSPLTDCKSGISASIKVAKYI
jgi:hypothetical protein